MLRHPAAHHRPRHLRGGVGRGRPAARRDHRGRQIAKVQAGLKRSESVGQRRMLDLNAGSKDSLEIHPNLWAGVGLVRGGAGTALVGSFTEIADLIEQYAAARHRRVRPLRLPAPRGVLLVRRGRAARARAGAASGRTRPRSLADRVRAVRLRAGGVMTTAVVVGNPKPASRTLAAATYVADELGGAEPTSWSIWPARRRLLDCTTTTSRGTGRARWAQRPGRRRVPDLQGDVHRPAEARSSTASPPTGLAGARRSPHARRLPDARAGAGVTLRQVLVELGGAVPTAGTTSSTARTTTRRPTPTGWRPARPAVAALTPGRRSSA